MQSSDEFLAHARHMDRRWERMLHQQQAQNQELQKNMVALASQMKGLEEEAIKKLRIKEPYSMLPQPQPAPRTLSTSSNAEATAPVGSSEGGGKVTSKGGEEVRGEGKGEREKDVTDGASADVSSVAAVKPDTDINYGKLIIHLHVCMCLFQGYITCMYLQYIEISLICIYYVYVSKAHRYMCLYYLPPLVLKAWHLHVSGSAFCWD